MDRFSEQLIQKTADSKDVLKRVLIIVGEILLLCLLAFICIVIPTVFLVCFAAAAGSFFLFKFLMESTAYEYEYIVTNDDLDIDKITGQRSRKRLITISLRTVKEMGRYNGEALSADVTVVAHDGTGQDIWYLIAESNNYGNVALLFNPDERTITNIVGGLEPKLRLEYKEKFSIREEAEEGEN